ncbi:MAG: DUF4430 domain-containing protein [Oscillospiraceae bacterium]|nr:DUF4430 domain-containing protein [Oscillospiraceae bacterium]
MKKISFIRIISFILCVVLLAAAVLCASGCKKKDQPKNDDEGNNNQSDVIVLGEGATKFTFKYTDADGNTKTYEINTDETTVGAALLKVNLIAGDTSDFGLYVKTVDGKTYDYNTDGKYWAFYINGTYASTGVDSTNITAGEVYEFKAE